MVCKHISSIIFLNEIELIIFCTELSGFKYCYVSVAIYHQQFVYTHLNSHT